MAHRTITALYQNKADAERARDELESAGFGGDIDIHDEGGSSSGSHGEGGFMESLKNFFGGHEDAHAYGEGLRRGNYLLTARVDENEADRAVSTLEASNALDLDQTQTGWRTEGWTGAATKATATDSVAAQPSAASGAEQVIPIVEEQLRVGKREVERGGVRVRSYVVETPVNEQIGLREERVSIERRPVDQRTTNADGLFQERSIELTETAEEAVVAKDAVVREELVLRKDASERVENIQETVRRTEVDVDDTTRRGSETLSKPGAV